MSSYTRRIGLVAVAVVLAACESQPTAPAASPSVSPLPTKAASSVERTVETSLSSFEGVLTQFICEDGTTSELIALEGELFTRNTTTLNPSGTYTLTSHSMPVGVRGVGLESGQEYRVYEQTHYAVSQRDVAYSGTYRNVILLRGRESMEAFKLVTIAHYVVTPDGRVVVERQTVHSECGK